MPSRPVDRGIYNVVIIGGGIARSTAALAAALLGECFALI